MKRLREEEVKEWCEIGMLKWLKRLVCLVTLHDLSRLNMHKFVNKPEAVGA